jgi:hypothetical protein
MLKSWERIHACLKVELVAFVDKDTVPAMYTSLSIKKWVLVLSVIHGFINLLCNHEFEHIQLYDASGFAKPCFFH